MRKIKKFSGINTILIIVILFANIYLTSINLTRAKYVAEMYTHGSAQSANWNVSLKYNDITQTGNYDIPLDFTATPRNNRNFYYIN